ncbi:MAG: hypothetical protein IV090_02580 [Candidatus Sericytochromatia bacterium]|nr:hypothetical protein [Candidatus Sericytochromatia bacterium]
MYTKREFPLKMILRFTSLNILAFALLSSSVVAAYQYLHFKMIAIPFLPVSMIGAALAFYLGFKNNSSYDRLWEARKIWGGIVNDSRAWTAMLNAYLNPVNDESLSESALSEIRHELAKRHLAWIYAHKFQLRHKRMSWEHNLSHNNLYREKFQQAFGIGTDLKTDLQRYLQPAEADAVMACANPAAQILNNQSLALKKLRQTDVIEDFRLFEMQNHLNKLFEHQGKNERIKNFPFPRQYSMMVSLSVNIFCFLLPFGLISEMGSKGDLYVWLTVPFSVLISWVYFFMEMNSDYCENPFEGLINDVPIPA